MEWIDTHRNKILRLREHEVFLDSTGSPTTVDDESFDLLHSLRDKLQYKQPTQALPDLQLLGMDIVPYQPQLQMGYYVGVDWIDRKAGTSIEVLPKIKDLDFQAMLLKCFEHESEIDDLDKIFYIRDTDAPVCIPYTDFQLEPFVIITFLNLVEGITRKGLKSNFITRQERLESKIKGKIMISQYLKHGYANGRKGSIDCKFEEFSIDCFENQIIKTALIIIGRMMSEGKGLWGTSVFNKSQEQLRRCLSAFENVSVLDSSLRHRSANVSPMFVEYKSAIRIAKMIIRKEGIGICQATEDGCQMVPPFIIDMSLLFEKYVFALMLDIFDSKTILYQKGSKTDRPDFLKRDEQLIIDTKYKPSWEEGYITDDVRQLSGYGRSYSIRRKLNITDEAFTCPCLIIYPNEKGLDTLYKFEEGFIHADTPSDGIKVTPVSDYQKLYKLAMKLPTIKIEQQIR